jgi:hypothetical protein
MAARPATMWVSVRITAAPSRRDSP